jgi:hypothetical protein
MDDAVLDEVLGRTGADLPRSAGDTAAAGGIPLDRDL